MAQLTSTIIPKLQHPVAVAVWAAIAAFLAYGSMYIFRKPFTAAGFQGLQWAGIDYKILLVLAQLAGYMVSKFLGVKLISELKADGRITFLLILMGIALFSLFLFAVTPFPYRWIWLFFNGLPLGMVFGVVFSFLEGRRFTELMTAGLGASIIFASGFAKTTGLYLLHHWHISEWWMPFAAGCVALPVLCFSIWMLGRIPPPNAGDIQSRTLRLPMTSFDRRLFFRKYATGIILLILIYVLLTAFRDLRDNFAVEIWAALGYPNHAGLMVRTELYIALFVLAVVGGLSFIRKNLLAFSLTHLALVTGGAVMAICTWMFQLNIISANAWMITCGFGLFLAYTMYQGILFERMVATFREKANVGFLMYLADAIGYLGSGGVLLWRNFGVHEMAWLDFFVRAAYITAGCVVIPGILSWYYFTSRYKKSLIAPLSIPAQKNAA